VTALRLLRGVKRRLFGRQILEHPVEPLLRKLVRNILRDAPVVLDLLVNFIVLVAHGPPRQIRREQRHSQSSINAEGRSMMKLTLNAMPGSRHRINFCPNWAVSSPAHAAIRSCGSRSPTAEFCAPGRASRGRVTAMLLALPVASFQPQSGLRTSEALNAGAAWSQVDAELVSLSVRLPTHT
jgi:hypothetical protein